jgi:hypothetical protein
MIVPTPLIALSLRNAAAADDALATDPRDRPTKVAELLRLSHVLRDLATEVDRIPPWVES